MSPRRLKKRKPTLYMQKVGLNHKALATLRSSAEERWREVSPPSSPQAETTVTTRTSSDALGTVIRGPSLTNSTPGNDPGASVSSSAHVGVGGGAGAEHRRNVDSTIVVGTSLESDQNETLQGVTANSLVEELLCPITMEIPLDPVIAEDGRVYGREASHCYFFRQASLVIPCAPACRQSSSGSAATIPAQ